MDLADPRMRAASAAWRIVTRELGIKATPPEYRAITATLEQLMADGFASDIDPALVEQAVQDMAATMDLPSRSRPAAARRIMRTLAADLEARGRALPVKRQQQLGAALAAAYRLGSTEVAQGLGWEIGWTLPDQDALAGLHDSGLFWIGNFYGNHWTDDLLLRRVQETLIEKGLGRVEAGAKLRELLGTQIERSDVYWRGLAATVATRARSFGALSSLTETGATTYEYVNPLDERTSDVCRELDGTVFTVKGSVELRDQVLLAKNPQDVKAIAPWPKVGDLQRSDGSRRSASELQAQGIAWPPLHFHCRSSIDVATWGPMPDVGDDLGDVDVARTVRPPRRPRMPTRQKPKEQAGTIATAGTPWETAKAELDSARAAAVAAGLDVDRHGVSAALGQDLGRLRLKLGIPDSRLVREAMASAGSRHQFVHALPVLERHDKTLAARLGRELALHDRMTVAYRKAAQAAPRTWRQAERRRLRDQLIQNWPRGMKRETQAAAEKALEAYPVDLLRLVASDGVQVRHSGRNKRAFAPYGTEQPIVMDMRRLTATNAWRGQDTLVHELGHKLDMVLGDSRDPGVFSRIDLEAGHPWKARPGYDDVPELWATAYGDPFDRAKQPAFGSTTTVLPGERGSFGRHQWQGRWAHPYDARIYSHGRANQPPTAADLADPGKAGPIEFVAMANGRRARDQRRLLARVRISSATEHTALSTIPKGEKVDALELILAGGPAPGRKVKGVSVGLVNDTERLIAPMDTRIALYGTSHRDAMEALYGNGRRFAEELAEQPDLEWQGDGDVYATALVIRHRYGTPLDDLLSPGAPLASKLSTPWDGNDWPTDVIPTHSITRGQSQASWEQLHVRMIADNEDVR